jgi:hypothetical protein
MQLGAALERDAGDLGGELIAKRVAEHAEYADDGARPKTIRMRVRGITLTHLLSGCRPRRIQTDFQ